MQRTSGLQRQRAVLSPGGFYGDLCISLWTEFARIRGIVALWPVAGSQALLSYRELAENHRVAGVGSALSGARLREAL